MKYISLEKKPIAYSYLIKETNDDSMRIIYSFLTSDISDLAYEFIEFLENPQDTYASGNACDIRKVNGNVIITYQLFECDEGYDDPDFIPELRFQTTIPEFIKLLKQWDAAIRTIPRPQELLITQDNSGKLNLDIKK